MGIAKKMMMVAIGLGLALTGCITPASQPFQAHAAGSLASYGYSEAKIDASHYSVSYSDTNAKGADAYLELRAAQLAKQAGYRYFALDGRRSDIVRRTESELDYTDVRQRGRSGNGGSGMPNNPMESVPGSVMTATTRYYYASGNVALLTDEQARGNVDAIAVSDVLARQAGIAAP